jgi:hypothetical protein
VNANKGKSRAAKDSEMAAMMKRNGVERTTGRCPNCYRIVTIESSKSRNTHIGKF